MSEIYNNHYMVASSEIRDPETKEFQPLLIPAYTGDRVAAPRQYAGSPVTFATKSTEAAAIRLLGNIQVVKPNPDADISPDNTAVITGIERPTITAEGTRGDSNSRRLPFHLYKLPDGTKDEYDGTTGRYVQRIGRLVLNGTEAWGRIGTVPYFRVNKVVVGNPAAVLSTHFMWGEIADNNNTLGVKIADNGTDIVLRTNMVTTVDALKAYLAAQAASDTPVTIYYELAQPIISYHRADLACYDGDTTVSCSDPLATDMEVTVYDIRPAGDARTLGGCMPYAYIQSNKNVLVNSAFTVNQRGFTGITDANGVYGVDNWRFYGGTDDTWSLKKDDGTYLHCTAPEGRSTNKQPLIRQWFEADLRGKQMTISLECWNRSDESAHSSFYFWDGKTQTGGPDVDSVRIPNSDHWIVVHKTFVVPHTFADPYQSLVIRPALEREEMMIDFKVRRVKIELGPISTLHLDPPPNYGQELIKCQRYCITASYVGLRASVVSPSVFYFNVPTPVTMYSTPAIVQNKMSVNALDGTAQTGFSFSIVGKSAGAIIVRAEKTNHGLKDAYLYCGHIGGQPTIFSAEL